jgi:hypothetical protein
VDWKEISNDGGLVLWAKELPDDPILVVKGAGDIEAPAWKVASVILDQERGPEWVERLEASRLIRAVGPDEFIGYTRVGTPILLKNRDFVAKGKVEVSKETKTITISVTGTADPAVPETDSVRGKIKYARYVITALGPNRAHIIAEIQVDPMGSIPKWVFNLFQRSWPKRVFEGIRHQTAKLDIKPPAYVAEALKPAESF